MVESEPDFTIPTTLSYRAHDMKRPTTVMVVYRNMEKFCRLCKKTGHPPESCVDFPQLGVRKSLREVNHALEVDLVNNPQKFTEADYVAEAGADNIPPELLPPTKSPFDRLMEERQKGEDSFLESEIGVTCFCAAHPSNSLLSNFTKPPAPFTFGGRTFTSTEQALQLTRAKAAGDTAAYKEISKASKPSEMKSAAEKIQWKGTSHAYLKLSFDTLYYSNRAKILANPGLKKNFLSTTGSFSETNTGRNSIWGAGLTWVEPAVNDRVNYNKRKNLFGQLLTLLKFELRREEGWAPPETPGRPRSGSLPGKRPLETTEVSDPKRGKSANNFFDSIENIEQAMPNVENSML
jgi:ribA/ribD-fused uncharacterized protein